MSVEHSDKEEISAKNAMLVMTLPALDPKDPLPAAACTAHAHLVNALTGDLEVWHLTLDKED